MEDEACGECASCPHYLEAFSRFSHEYVAWVALLYKKLNRIKLAPHLATKCSIREIDLFIVIDNFEKEKAIKEAKEK